MQTFNQSCRGSTSQDQSLELLQIPSCSDIRCLIYSRELYLIAVTAPRPSLSVFLNGEVW